MISRHTVRWIVPQYSRDEGYFYCEGCKSKLTNGVAYVDGIEYQHVLEGQLEVVYDDDGKM